MATMPRPAMLGGAGKTVHVDEVALPYLRSTAGDAQRSAIVLGMACDDVTICGTIPNRKAETIIPIVRKRVRAGSRIVTDMHKAYGSLASLGYEHVQINHSVAFHDFKGNTNNPIEMFWATLRRNFRGFRNVSEENLWHFIAEIEYRYNRRLKPHIIFEELITKFPECWSFYEDNWRARFEWHDRTTQYDGHDATLVIR